MYKFRQSFKLDDYSGACVEVLVGEDDQLSVRAIDLIGDGWWNFLDAVKCAEEFHLRGEIHCENQEIHRGLTSLATHLDGVVCGMCDRLKKELADFSPPAYGRRKDCTLAEKIKYITCYVQDVRRLDLRAIDLTFKVVRDLLIHPYAKKTLSSASETSKKQLTQGDVYDLTIEELKKAGSMVDEWLAKVTEMFEHPRGYDTKRLAESFASRVVQEYRKASKLELPNKIDATIYRI